METFKTAEQRLLSDDEVKYLMLLVTFDRRSNSNFLKTTSEFQYENQRAEATKHIALADSIINKIKPPS
jgi:hypothetical protein